MHDLQTTDILRATGAWTPGHFLTRNGKHTDALLECSHLVENTAVTEELCDRLFAMCKDAGAELVVGTASGGMIIGYGIAKRLGLKFMYGERRESGMQLRRGFRIPEHTKVLLVEDIVSTGSTVQQMLQVIRHFDAEPIAVATVVDRTRGRWHLPVKMISLVQVEAKVFTPSTCPMCAQGIPMSPTAMEVR